MCARLGRETEEDQKIDCQENYLIIWKKMAPARRSGKKKLIPQLNLGHIPNSYRSQGVKAASKREFDDLVRRVTPGPQIVSLPVPPERHVFLIDVQPDVIRVCDWNGAYYRSTGLPSSKRFQEKWKQYSELLSSLQTRFHVPVQYYPVDKDLRKEAERHNAIAGGGGCSYYLFAWIARAPEYATYSI